MASLSGCRPHSPRDRAVRLGHRYEGVGAWKTWEYGAPELAIEIVCPSEGERLTWDEKLARYHELGVRELVRFDAEDPGAPLRACDRIEGDLVERVPSPEKTACATLGLSWIVAPIDGITGVRLARGPRLLETREEAAQRARREAEARADAAEAKVRELEEMLLRKRSGE
jgi:hypothetical protein